MRASGRSERAAARLRRKRTRAAPASGRLQIEKDGDQERQQAQKLRRSEADEQAALLAVGRRRIAQRAFQEAAENIAHRSEEHTSELQSLMRNSYAVFCLKKKKQKTLQHRQHTKNHD